ncbi:hypothetical protein K9M78_06505 [Candidatus Bipolaricaulota bacterium]|nr:hypothetical protein [Candidatus Bipolaricaulota bacterium]
MIELKFPLLPAILECQEARSGTRKGGVIDLPGDLKLKKGIFFLKGHMGGNEIVLLPRREFPEESELELGLKVLERPHIGGDQLGLLYERAEDSLLGSKILDVHSRDYLSICGGLTQVLGKAHREFDLGNLFELPLPERTEDLTLETEVGAFPIRNDLEGRTTSVVDSFVESVYRVGVESGTVNGVLSFRVGNFFVTFEEEVKKRYPGASFNPLDEGTKEILVELQKEFRKEFSTGRENRDFAVMGETEDKSSAGRLIFPHNLSEGSLEPSCGTGTVAVAIALVERGSITGPGELELEFESGGGEESIGGPEITNVTLEVESGRVKSARFSHSLVEILAVGKLYL